MTLPEFASLKTLLAGVLQQTPAITYPQKHPCSTLSSLGLHQQHFPLTVPLSFQRLSVWAVRLGSGQELFSGLGPVSFSLLPRKHDMLLKSQVPLVNLHTDSDPKPGEISI